MIRNFAQALRKSSLVRGITSLFAEGWSKEALDGLERLLLSVDVAPDTTRSVLKTLKKTEGGPMLQALREVLMKQFEGREGSLDLPSHHPTVVLVAGINGSGKTTTVGKLAAYYTRQGLKVHLGACDTFRAAATEQLTAWGQRVGSHVTVGPSGGDPAAVAYQAFQEARSEACDLLLLDTAGRLQNKTNLMDELGKIARVLGKQEPSAPHESFLVLDASVGQNTLEHVRVFNDTLPITGLIMTKLDGSARGGLLVTLAHQTHIPICAVGLGEGMDDIKPFLAKDYIDALLAP